MNEIFSNSSPGCPPGKVLVGLAGWSYPDWKGLVYPHESNFDKLQYLSEFFDLIEVNTSFYAIPTQKTVQNWLKSVAAKSEFIFTVKLYKQFTHGKNIEQGKPEIQPETLAEFDDAFRPMLKSGRLGALLLQFPYRFHNEPGNQDYLLRLIDTFQGYPLVVEVRHKSFDTTAFYELLKERRVAFANIDQPVVSDSLPPTRVFTSPDIGYLRFHGRNATTWFASDAGRDARYNYRYSQEELESYVGMIQEFRHRRGTLYVIFNNHYRAAEVKNALEFLHQITAKPVRIMPPLLKAYPELKSIALHETPERPQIQPGQNYRLFD